MGLLNWFKKPPSNATVLDDVIWLTKAAKRDGIAQAVSHSLAAPNRPDAIILVAHFSDCLAELEKIVEDIEAPNPIKVVSAGALKSGIFIGGSQVVQLIVGERHPLPSHNQDVLEFAENLLCRSTVVHHVSLEDAIMRAFAGEWVQSVLKNLGMSESEAIESPMVARRLQAAQKKLGKECLSDFPATSAEEWMERNCPSLWCKNKEA